MSDTFVPALGKRYEFKEDRIVFEDGVSYTLAEAMVMAKDRLDEADIQAIHLVKQMFDGTIVSTTNVDTVKRVVTETRIVQEELPLAVPQSEIRNPQPLDLDALGESFGELPILNR